MKKSIIVASIGLILFTVLLFNLFGYNNSGERVVRVSITGQESVIFAPGPYWDGFAKTYTYPDQITLLMDDKHDFMPKVTFNGGGSGFAHGVAKFLLPKDEKSMLKIHHDYRSEDGLIETGLKKFTVECLNSSSQLMTAETHYMGGKTQMSQNFYDQLDHGVYISETDQITIIDSVTKEKTKEYIIEIKKNKDGTPQRKLAALDIYNIGIGDASISEVDYDEMIDNRIKKLMETATRTAVSKSNTINAQQEALTKEAEGKKELVTIEYEEKKVQTKAIIQAETAVKLAAADKEKQRIAAEAAELEAKKIKILADAEAYAKQKVMIADGALDKKLKAYVDVQTVWAEAYANYKGNIVPLYQGSGPVSGYNGFNDFMNIQMMRSLKDFNLNISTK